MNDVPPEQAAPVELPDAARKTLAGRLRAVLAELRSHPVAYGVTAVFIVAGPLYAAYSFPELPLGLMLFGGVAFGIYAALCAVPDQFL